MDFTRGMLFSTYQEFESLFETYCTKNNVQFWKRESNSIKNAIMSQKYTRGSNPNEKAVYYSLKLCCVFGGRTFKGVAVKRKTTTLRQDCPAFFRLSLSKSGQYLELKDFDLQHNHEINETSYKLLRQQRRLPLAVQKKASHLLKMKVSKKVVQSQLMLETGKIILLKDLSNVAQKFKHEPETLSDIISNLKQFRKCTVSVFQENKKLKGIFFQDKLMKQAFEIYPEILLFEGPYKLLCVQYMCFLFLIEDGNGNFEVVGAGLMAEYNLACLNWLTETFKDNNEICSKTRIIVTGKLCIEKEVFQPLFPDAKLSFCLFHVLKASKHEVTPENMSITLDQKQSFEEYLRKFFCSYSEEQYNKTYSEFIAIAPEPIKTYYCETWHPIRQEWTLISYGKGSYLSTTNTTLEKVHAKLKSVVKTSTSIESFIENIFILLHFLRNESNYNFTESVLKSATASSFAKRSIEEKYHKLLLPSPLEFVLEQLKTSEPDIIFEVGEGIFSFTHDDKLYATNQLSCSCLAHKDMLLPCKHVFAVRKFLKMDLYDADLCDIRWTRHYACKHQRIFAEDPTEKADNDSSMETNDASILDLENVKIEHSYGTPSDLQSTNDDSAVHISSVPTTPTYSTTSIRVPATSKYAINVPTTSIHVPATPKHAINVPSTTSIRVPATPRPATNVPTKPTGNNTSSNIPSASAPPLGHFTHGIHSNMNETPKSQCCCYKLTQCSILTSELTSVMLQCSEEQFTHNMKLMETLIACFRSGKNIVLAEIAPEDEQNIVEVQSSQNNM